MIEYIVKVYPKGSMFWTFNGRYHREDGPACEWMDGDKLWYLNGKLHREDGPACEWANGRKEWYLDGYRYMTESDYRKEMAKRKNPCNGKVVEIDGKKYQLTAV